MSERLIVLRQNNRTLRVRKEDFGCVIFDSDNIYVEGNETVYEILRQISMGKQYDEIVTYICSEYGMHREMVESDIREFFSDANMLGWFTDYKT
jgi:hypothetical protein